MARAAAFLLLGTCLVLGPESLANALNIVSRSQWGARAPSGTVNKLSQDPAPYIVIHHADTPTCTTMDACKKRVKSIQDFHIHTRKWSDIGYNFLVGEDGNVYEGRGWHKQGAHAVNYNSKSIGICIIGDYASHQPNAKAVKATKDLINYAINHNMVKSNYKLVGHRQVGWTTCPGNSLYTLIKTWPHYASTP